MIAPSDPARPKKPASKDPGARPVKKNNAARPAAS